MQKSEKTKTPKESAIETRYIVMPDHANHYGTAFGGVIMSWIDLIAVMVAQRHCEREAVTLSVDRLTFISPIQIGDHVILRASVNYTGTSSMEIGVQVIKENPYKQERVRAVDGLSKSLGRTPPSTPSAAHSNTEVLPTPFLLPSTNTSGVSGSVGAGNDSSRWSIAL